MIVAKIVKKQYGWQLLLDSQGPEYGNRLKFTSKIFLSPAEGRDFDPLTTFSNWVRPYDSTLDAQNDPAKVKKQLCGCRNSPKRCMFWLSLYNVIPKKNGGSIFFFEKNLVGARIFLNFQNFEKTLFFRKNIFEQKLL